MNKTIQQLRERAREHGYIYWWEFPDVHEAVSWMSHCNTFIFNEHGSKSHLLILGDAGVLKIWINMEDKR